MENYRLEQTPIIYKRWILAYLGKSIQILTGAIIKFIRQMLRLLVSIPTGNSL